MGETKLQKLIFTTMMCFLMVLVMTVYNMYLNMGWVENFLGILVLDFWPGFFVALILDIFIVGPLAKKFAHRLHQGNPEVKKIVMILTISCTMVVGMVIFMSAYGCLHNGGFAWTSFSVYHKVALKNFVVALPLNILIVGNLVRFLFSKMFKIDVKEDPEEAFLE